MDKDNADFLLACNEVHDGNIREETLFSIVGKLPIFPKFIAQQKLLSTLRAAALKSSVNRQLWFYTKHQRPQLLEVREAPLTSIYASRITTWTYLQEERPVAFAVTGHGPGPVCSRVSAIINDLANERNHSSDIILAGVSFIDLTEESPIARSTDKWGPRELIRRVSELAVGLGIGEFMQQQNNQRLLTTFARRVARPTLETIRQSLNQISAEMGFVVNKCVTKKQRQAALCALEKGNEPLENDTIPILVTHRANEKPLRIKLPRLCLGVDEYERIVKEYRRSVTEEMHQEWERRQRKYEGWARNFVISFQRLRRNLTVYGQAALLKRRIYIDYEIDPETATEIRLDPPQPQSELEYLAKLPSMITNQLAYWAWANYKVETLPEMEAFRPHWEQSCLVDAFLRDWPLPTEDVKLNVARDAWVKKWRPLALIALDTGLRDYGLSLTDIAIENTVFRVVEEDDHYLTLELLHIWDPSHDSLPKSNKGTTLFAPSFGNRTREWISAKKAQERALKIVNRLLLDHFISSEDLQSMLSQDSGEALDNLLEYLCLPFLKDDLDSDIVRILNIAEKKVDPLARFGLQARFHQSSTLNDLLTLARDCGKEGAKRGAIPDFLVWELYLVGEAVRNVIKNMLDHAREQQLSGVDFSFQGSDPWNDPWGDPWENPPQTLSGNLGLGDPRLPDGFQINCLQQMSAYNPWQIIDELIRSGKCADTVRSILRYIEAEHLVSELFHAYQLLQDRHADFLGQCFSTDSRPSLSPQRENQYAPGCFTGWDRVCYDIAEGDCALGLAWTIREGGKALDSGMLAKLYGEVSSFYIPSNFENLVSHRDKLVKDLEKHHMQGSRANLDSAMFSVRQVLQELVLIAEVSYQRAALQDKEHGCGWLRLARLKWLTAHYREAVSILIGPKPQVDLQACQLPFSVALGAAGSLLNITDIVPEAWSRENLGDINVAVSSPKGDDLVLEFITSTSRVGTCIVSGLSQTDTDRVREFFQKYRLDMLQSRGVDSFEEWLCLIQVPNLGRRAIIAEAIDPETEFALLAACVFLGVPGLLGTPPDDQIPSRPEEWLEEQVVTRLEWKKR